MTTKRRKQPEQTEMDLPNRKPCPVCGTPIRTGQFVCDADRARMPLRVRDRLELAWDGNENPAPVEASAIYYAKKRRAGEYIPPLDRPDVPKQQGELNRYLADSILSPSLSVDEWMQAAFANETWTPT